MTYRYAWGPRMRGIDPEHYRAWTARKGALCRLIRRGGMNSAEVEFEDGYRAIVSRNALRRIER